MSDATRPAVNAEEARTWNSGIGRNWVEYQDQLDELFAAVSRRLLERTRPGAGERILDVGCGTGATTLAAAGLVGAAGSAVGLDISRQLLASARRRSAGRGNVTYLEADAQTHAFEGDPFDLVISRFGVMFFEDPVAAFRNIASALRPGARLVFAAWARMSDNPWFDIPREVAAARLGAAPPAPPDAPGPFGFADTGRVLGLLRAAGLADCVAEEEVVELSPGGMEAALELASRVGPTARLMLLHGGTDEDARAIGESVAGRFARYVVDGEVRIPARINFFEAVKA